MAGRVAYRTQIEDLGIGPGELLSLSSNNDGMPFRIGKGIQKWKADDTVTLSALDQRRDWTSESAIPTR